MIPRLLKVERKLLPIKTITYILLFKMSYHTASSKILSCLLAFSCVQFFFTAAFKHSTCSPL